MKWALVLVPATACGGAHPEPCTQAERAKISAWYQSEIAVKCSSLGYDTDNCPSMPEIEAEYDRRYDEWVRCRK